MSDDTMPPGFEEVVQTAATNGEPFAPEFSEDRLAQRFVDRHGADMRYCAAWGHWMIWNGVRWQRDDTMAAFDYARKITREAASQCDKDAQATAIASAKTVAAVERLARSDRRVAASAEQWDADAFSLNTPDGVVDLRTSRMEPSRRDLYQTKITNASPQGDCPVWLAHLARIFNGDAAMIGYAQRFCGYGLTGATKEHVFAYGHGVGANGKSRFIEAISWAMGDYATTSPMSVFTSTSSDSHPTEIARLRGARLVTASETEQNRQWAESRIKQLTGGDKVAARFMRADFFEFTPTFKLMVIGNHKPHLRAVDEAIKRRLHLWPFLVTIPPEERDPDLAEKLKAEAGGILRWAIVGALAWQRIGLDPPPAVIDATAAYFQAEDSFGAWLDECIERRGDRFTEPSTRVFRSWKNWAAANGEDPGTQKAFAAEMDRRGFARKRTSSSREIVGIYLKPIYSETPGEDQ